MNVLIFQVSSFTIYCINALIFHVSSFTIYYINALVIKASPLYILKQMPYVSICFRFYSQCLWKKKKVLDYRIYSQSTQQYESFCCIQFHGAFCPFYQKSLVKQRSSKLIPDDQILCKEQGKLIIRLLLKKTPQ